MQIIYSHIGNESLCNKFLNDMFFSQIFDILHHRVSHTTDDNVNISRTALGRLTTTTNSHRELRNWCRNP